jgi:DnaK suppressor protein
VPTEGAGAVARGHRTGLSARQTVQLRELLTARWQATVSEITELSLTLHAAPGDAQEPETVAELARLRWELTETEAALGRLEDGGYGVCMACDAPLAFERLETQPAARFCVRCQPG